MFGQIVIGPPGSGKSTYCHGMYQFMSAIGRKLCIINLDPANDRLPYPNCELDIRDFITIEEIMEELNLGPNGGLMYALESFDESGITEFVERVHKLVEEQNYLIFDCPGQVELFTHHNSLYKIFKKLVKSNRLRLCVVSLVDSIYLTSPSQYISILLLSLRSMLQLNLPHINVISKIDLLRNYGKLPFRLDYYTEVQDLSYLTPHLEKESNSILGKNYVRLTEMIAELVEDFNLVSFEVLAVENKQSMINLLSVIDKANGYSFGSEIGGDSIWSEATRQSGTGEFMDIDIHERWIEHKDKYDEMERNNDTTANEGNDKPLTEEEDWELALQDWESSRGGKGHWLVHEKYKASTNTDDLATVKVISILKAHSMEEADFANSLFEQLESTISNLQNKQEALENEVKSYESARDQLLRNKEPNAMVFLGQGYFVEKPRKDALESLDEKIKSLKQTASTFNTKLKEANVTRENLKRINKISEDETDKFNEEGLPYMEIQEQLDEEGNIISTSINNELVDNPPKDSISHTSEPEHNQKEEAKPTEDSENSMLKSSLNDTQSNDPQSGKDLSGDPQVTVKSTDAEAEYESILDLLEDMEIKSTKAKTASPQLIDQNELLDKIDSLNVSREDKFKLKQICIAEFKKLENGSGEGSQKEEYGSSRANDTRAFDSEISEKESDKIEDSENKALINSLIEENNLKEILNNPSDSEDTSSAEKNGVLVDRGDILQLEVLADDFVDEENAVDYADDEEWDFEFSEDDDDDDDELADEMLYGGKGFYVNSSQGNSANDMLWNQVLNLRQAKSGTEKIQETPKNLGDNSTSTNSTKNNKEKKTVRFAKNLDIKEIENISDALKNPLAQPKLSLFKQGKISRNNITVMQAQKQENETLESPISDIVIERENKNQDLIQPNLDSSFPSKSNLTSKRDQNEENKTLVSPVSDVVIERENNSYDQDIVQSRLVGGFRSEGRKVRVPDIEIGDGLEVIDRYGLMEQSILKNEGMDEAPKKVSRFKSSMLKASNNSRTSLKPEVTGLVDTTINGDIIEKNTSSIGSNDSTFMDNTPKKVSRFKSSILKASDDSKTHSKPDVNDQSSTLINGDIIEKNMSSEMNDQSGSSINGDIIEKNTSSISPDDSSLTYSNDSSKSKFSVEKESISDTPSKPQKVSRFKAGRMNKSSVPPGAIETASVPSAAIETTFAPEIGKDASDIGEDSSKDGDLTDDSEFIDLKEAAIDFHSMQNDLETMAKAYVLGVYDEDIETEGPVVDKVEDFEILNKMLESMPQQDNQNVERKNISNSKITDVSDSRLDEIGFDHYQENNDGEEDDEDSGPILEEEIIENTFDDYDEDSMALGLEDDIENDFINQEIVSDYHKLRQKLILQSKKSGYRKSEEEMEFEPVDEDGNPIKISRFMATKMN